MNNDQTNNEYTIMREEDPSLNGTFQATVNDIGEVQSGQYGDFVIIHYEIPAASSPSKRPFTFTIPYSMKLSTRSKLGKLLLAVYGRLPDIGTVFNVRSLIGRSLLLTLKTEPLDNFDKIIVEAHKALTPAPVPAPVPAPEGQEEASEPPF